MTIPIEVLKEVSVVFTHAHCPDGMASAMILKDAFRMLGMKPRITFLTHGTPEHKGAIDRHYLHSGNGRALFCDFAPHPDVYRDHVVAGDLVLDHHVGAKEIVEAFGALGVYADAEKEPGVSGAVLAFREVWMPVADHLDFQRDAPVPAGTKGAVGDFALCVGARDTWQTSDQRFQSGQWISKALMSQPAEYWLAGPTEAIPGHHPAYLSEGEVAGGKALFQAHQEAVRQATLQLVGFDVGDAVDKGDGRREPTHLLVFQEQASGFRLCSDVAEAVRKQNATYQYEPSVPRAEIVAGFAYVVDKPGDSPKVVYSLRGLEGFDVCAFAKANGGGGHKAAAGFAASLDAVNEYGSPYDFVHRRLSDYLAAG
jgi:hypothetical protein